MRRALAAAVALAVGLAIWVWRPAPEGGDAPDTGATARPAAGDDREATLRPAEGAAPSLGGRSPRLPAGDLTIGGRVVRRDGSAAVDVVVTAAPDVPGAPAVAQAVTNGAGEFLLEGLRAGLHRLRATLAEGDLTLGASAYAAAGYQESRLTLAPEPATLEIAVLDATGAPVPKFEARLVRGEEVRRLGAGREGRLAARVEGGPGGLEADDLADAYVEVWGARTEADLGLPWGAARAGPIHRSTRAVEVRLPAAPAIEGRLVPQDGGALPAGTLRAMARTPGPGMTFLGIPIDRSAMHPEELPPVGGPPAESAGLGPFRGLELSVAADAEGVFRIPHMGGTSPVDLTFSVPGEFLSPHPRQVVPGAPPLTIVLRRAVRVLIQVVDPGGAPVTGALVSAEPVEEAEPIDAQQQGSMTHSRGEASLDRLDATKRYALSVIATRRDDLAPYRDEAWQPQPTIVRLQAGGTVEGVVRDGRGAPVEGAYVWLRGIEDSFPQTTEDDGAYRFDAIPAGSTVRVLTGWSLPGASEQEPTSRAGVAVEVKPGMNRADLVLERGLTVRLILDPATPEAPAPPSSKWLWRSNVVVLRQTQAGWSHFNVAAGPEAGGTEYEIRGLAPDGTYAVWSPPSRAEPTYLYATFEAHAGTVRVRRERGGSVRVRLDPPAAGRSWDGVLLVDALGRNVRLPMTAAVEGEYRFEGLPQATWTVQVLGQGVAGGAWTAPQQVATGGSITLPVPWVR